MKKSCTKCGSTNVQKYGYTRTGAQRYQCLHCQNTYTWQNRINKYKQQQIWFRYWIQEGFNMRQLSCLSGYSPAKIKRIKTYWLNQSVPSIQYDLSQYKYLLLDGTYFKHEHCLLVFMDSPSCQIIGQLYTVRENYETVLQMAQNLKGQGLDPVSITLDGHQRVIRALREVWPQVKIQRCLYHIEHQGQMWLRTYPKTQAGKALKQLLNGLAHIGTQEGKDLFDRYYQYVRQEYEVFIKQLSSKTVGEKDVKKALSLINNAYKDMWYFLEDNNIPSTNNKLEGYFSELKQQYRKHKGLSKAHRESYLKWYIYYRNTSKTNTF